MNGNGTGVIPTVELAGADNHGYGYPVMPMMGGYGYGNGGFGFDGGIWALILIAILFGNGGFGFGNNGNNVATTDFVSSQFTQNSLQDLSTQICSGFANTNSTIANGNQNLSNLISNGFADNATNLCNVRSDILTGNMGIQNAILDSKYASAMGDANTQRDVLIQTTQLENQLSNVALSNQAHIDACCCDIKELIRADGDQTRALITQNTIQDLRDAIADKDRALQTATFNASQIDQTATLVNTLAPRSIPAYITSSPYQSIFPYNNGFWGNNWNYGNGFFGNTIV